MDASFVLDYDVISVAREHHLYLMARIKGGKADGNRPRPILNLSVILDRSGSMSGAKLDYVKQATQFLVKHLAEDDFFSLVTYDDTVSVPIKPGKVVHKDAINQNIQKIFSGGSTNLSGGWLQGCQLVAENQATGQNNRVMLLTDGLANQGIVDSARLGAMARQKREEGIATTTMGVGLDFNEDLLVKMAIEGGGAFYFIDNPDRAPAIFAEELQNLLNVVGQNLTITLIQGDNVRLVRQLNAYATESYNREVVFRLGDLLAEELKVMLLELYIPALQTLGPVEVARLRFEYDELHDETVTHQTLELPIQVNVTPDGQGAKPDQEVTQMVLLLRAADTREKAIEMADSGNFERASQMLDDMANEIEQHGINDKALLGERNMLREEARDMQIGAKRYDAYSRKVETTKIHASRVDSRSAPQRREMHERMRMERPAVELNGPVPRRVRWDQGTRELTGDTISIGRASDNDIVLEQDFVSAHHCRLERKGTEWFLVDLDSKNHTFANGGLVKQPFRLSVGDVVVLAVWSLFRFE